MHRQALLPAVVRREMTLLWTTPFRQWRIRYLIFAWAFLWLVSFLSSIWTYTIAKPLIIAADKSGELDTTLIVIGGSLFGLTFFLFSTGGAKLIGKILSQRLVPDD